MRHEGRARTGGDSEAGDVVAVVVVEGWRSQALVSGAKTGHVEEARARTGAEVSGDLVVVVVVVVVVVETSRAG